MPGKPSVFSLRARHWLSVLSGPGCVCLCVYRSLKADADRDQLLGSNAQGTIGAGNELGGFAAHCF